MVLFGGWWCAPVDIGDGDDDDYHNTTHDNNN
jgi:hypothetical protein